MRDLVGATLDGRYTIRLQVDEIGPTHVFLADDARVGREVWVRALREGSDPVGVAAKRLVRDARIAARVEHPNVLEASDLGVLRDGTPYVVTERLAGERLDERVRHQGALPVASALDIATQVLSALAAAHAHGIVHGAVQPERVFLVQRAQCVPHVKLWGFGDAIVDGEPRPRKIVRSPTAAHYVAPEQIRATGNPPGPAIDVYACGAVLYEMLTGRRPFTAPDPAALLREILVAPLRAPTSLRPELPFAVGAIVERAMRRDARQRFASAPDMQRAILDAQLAGSAELPLAPARAIALTDEHLAMTPARQSFAQLAPEQESWDDATVDEHALRKGVARPKLPSYGDEESQTIFIEPDGS